jgi:hypothetical protein
MVSQYTVNDQTPYSYRTSVSQKGFSFPDGTEEHIAMNVKLSAEAIEELENSSNYLDWFVIADSVQGKGHGRGFLDSLRNDAHGECRSLILATASAAAVSCDQLLSDVADTVSLLPQSGPRAPFHAYDRLQAEHVHSMGRLRRAERRSGRHRRSLVYLSGVRSLQELGVGSPFTVQG